MQTIKETAANVAASAKSGMEKTKAAVQEKQGINAGTGGSYSHSTTGGHQMSALPGHGTGQPRGQVVEGTVKSHPIGIGTATSTGRPLRITSMSVGAGDNRGYGTGAAYRRG